MIPEGPKLSYFLAEKKGVLIVSLVGPLIRSNAHIFEACINEIAESKAKWIVLNFRDVPPQIDRTVIPAIARLQKMLRQKGDLRLSSVHPELKKLLDDQGLLRPEELVNNLADALQALCAKESMAA